jgi:nucleoside-diphosphate-sugar epimerase
MRIALTGAGGGVGRAVAAAALAQGHTVVGIDRPGVEIPTAVSVHADLTSYQEFENAVRGCDGLIHLAAFPSPGRRPAYETHHNNVLGSYNALCAAVELGINRVCMASSINAIGGAYSRSPRYDYFPLDEEHPTYDEDPYSLSKWICEAQADSMARRYESMTIATLRFHWVVKGLDVVQDRGAANPEVGVKQLWGYTTFDAAASACLLSLTADFTGHERFYIVAPRTVTDVDSQELAKRFYPDTKIVGDLTGQRSFFDSGKAERLLGWKHDSAPAAVIEPS